MSKCFPPYEQVIINMMKCTQKTWFNLTEQTMSSLSRVLNSLFHKKKNKKFKK